MYKGIQFIKSSPKDPLDLFFRAIDWVENEGCLVPTTVLLKPPMRSELETQGKFKPYVNRIYLYRHNELSMELALVHELIHARQFNGREYEKSPRFTTPLKPTNARSRYMLDPTEIEAYWYQNRYSKEYYGIPHFTEKEYEALGIDLSSF